MDLERLQLKHAEAQRKLGIAEATERSYKLQLKSAEASQKGMKEEMARMKVLVHQTRNQCAVEVRKRERVVEGLKRHVGDGRVRGGGKTVGVREIVVVAGVGAEDRGVVGGSVQDEGYDLRSETNEFLTELARGLSEENENLAALVRRTVNSLKTLSGWEKDVQHTEGGEMVIPLEMSYENIASEMDAVIEHVSSLLTNPSFVPLEEVEVREEEIIRLREGWERMENRWREAVQMMDGWRKRMARSGQTVNLEELKMGLSLSPLKERSEEVPHNLQLSMVMEEGDTQADIDAMEEEEQQEDEEAEPDFDDEMDSESSLFEDEPVEEEEIVDDDGQDEGFTFNTESSIGPAPQLSPLRETNGNAYRAGAPSPPRIPERNRGEGFSTIMEENTYDLLQLEKSSPPKTVKSARSTLKTQTPQERTSERKTQKSASKLSISTPGEDEISLLKTSNPTSKLTPNPAPRSRARSASPKKVSRPQPTPKATATPRLKNGSESRLPRPRDIAPQQSPLTMATIAAKLAASEREADAARVRAKIKAMRANRAPVAPASKPAAAPRISSISSSEGSGEKDWKAMPPPPIRLVPNDDPEANWEVSRDELSKSGSANVEDAGVESKRTESKKRKAPVSSRGQGKVSRRRSTLSPWELESLMLGGIASPAKE